jgi:hypothetical protein
MQPYRASGIFLHNVSRGCIFHVTMYVCMRVCALYIAPPTTTRFVALNINGHEYKIETHESCGDVNKETLFLIVFRNCLLFNL